jgi:diguanylate cyclase (GGDEF)-like protein
VAALAVVGGLAAAAAVLGLLVHGGEHPGRWKWSWALLTVGLVASLGGALLGAVAGAGGRTAGDVVALLGAVCSIVGLVRLLQQRLGARSADVIFEAVMTAAGVGFVVGTLVLRPGEATGALGAGGIATLARPLLDLVAVWLAVRLVWLTPTHPAAYRYLLGGFVCLLTADAIAAGAALGGSAGGQPNAVALWSYCLRAVAACHPSLRSAFEPVTDGPKRLRRPQLVLVVGLVLLGPAMLATRVGLGGSLGVSVVLGSALLPLLVVVHLVRHVQERASAEYEAQHDALTGLPNRVLFHDRLDVALSQARRSGTRVAVMFCDLDRFKSINDSLGHAVGNQLLQGVGRRLRACLRPTDTVARVGGDEFTLLVPSVSTAAESAAVAERILQELKAPYVVAGRELFTSVSIGMALFPDDGTDPETLLKHADTAMYRAKASGRDGYQQYTADMGARAQVKHSLENSLRHAIERRELRLHYQPKVGLADGKVVGLEALLRWPHPILGWVEPAAFIPLAEETGLIGPLGEWVMEEACQQIRAWRDRGLRTVPVAINLSARQLAQGNVVDLIAGALARAGVAPELLEVEITESVFLHDAQGVGDRLQRLRAMGVRCSIDDFGTGYSGLAYLARMPLDSLKIDRSFVSRIGTADDQEAIVDAVIALGHSLRLKVVAEGVETAEQAQYLRSRGCDQMQGYLFSRPVPAEDVPGLLTAPAPATPGPRHLVLVGGPPAPATSGPDRAAPMGVGPQRSGADLGCLLHAVCGDADIGTPDPEAVSALVAALEPAERAAISAAPRQRSVPVRVAAGMVAGLVPLSGSIAAAGALPGPA